MAPRPGARATGRPTRYTRELLPLLERAWIASDQLSGKLLRPILPALPRALATHHAVAIPAAVRTALTASAATLDRLLRPLRRRRARQPWRPSPAAAHLRTQVPVRT